MTPLIAAALSTMVPTLAQQGLDLLSGLFSGVATNGASKVANYVQEQTGIELGSIASNRLSDEQWAALREFEGSHKAQILSAYVQDSTEGSTEPVGCVDARTIKVAVMDGDDKLRMTLLLRPGDKLGISMI